MTTRHTGTPGCSARAPHRSGPLTTTTPSGKIHPKKEIDRIVEAHHPPYQATAISAFPLDLFHKVEKALTFRGPSFIHLLAPCPTGWRFPHGKTIEVGRMAVRTAAWVLWERVHGRLSVSAPSKGPLTKPVPLQDYLGMQGRFKGHGSGPPGPSPAGYRDAQEGDSCGGGQGMKEIVTANYAIAEAVKQAVPKVIAAYPITPQTEIVERIAQYVARGELACDYIPVESEHSAMAACIGASAAGVRTFTATSSQGLLYMHEMLHWAAGARLPIVMANVNRAVGPPWNVWADHTDALSQRDTGWLQVYVATAQEAYDTTLMAFRIAEDKEVLLPVMVNLDGFLLSHTMQDLETLEPGTFIPALHLPHAIDTAHPAAYAPLTGPNDYFRFRWEMERSMRAARRVITRVEEDFAAGSGAVTV